MGELNTLLDTISAGTTVALRRSDADYPASSGWALTLHLRGASSLDVTVTADGGDHLLTLTATATAALVPGDYRWVKRASKGSGAALEAHVAASCSVSVTPNLAAATFGAPVP
jgi:hypothetical protein